MAVGDAGEPAGQKKFGMMGEHRIFLVNNDEQEDTNGGIKSRYGYSGSVFRTEQGRSQIAGENRTEQECRQWSGTGIFMNPAVCQYRYAGQVPIRTGGDPAQEPGAAGRNF